MTQHLEDHEVDAAVAGLGLDKAARDHLDHCIECRRKVAAIEELIDARRGEMTGQEPDWEAQREAVLDRLPHAAPSAPVPRRGWWRPALAVAAVTVMAVGVGLLSPRGVELPSDLSDAAVEEILAEVEAVLADDSIPGFELIDPGYDDLESYLTNGTS
jgi:anti-sigma factor RsiW